MSIVYITGFETGDLTEASSSSGTISVQSTTKRTGTYALRSNPTTSGTGYVALLAGNPYSTASSLYLRFYFNVATLPASNYESIAVINPFSGNIYLRLTSAGNLMIIDKSSVTHTGSTVLATNTWYRLELSYNYATGGVEAKIDGTSEITCSFSGAGDVYAVQIGKVHNDNNQSVDFYYDDVAISNSAYPGAGQCEILLPSGPGTYTNWSKWGGGTPLYSDVNEIPPVWATGTAVPNIYRASSAYDYITFTTGGLSSPANSVNAVKVLNSAGTITASNGYNPASYQYCQQAVAVVSGGTPYHATTTGQAIGYNNLSLLYTTDPATGSAWTGDGVNALEIGAYGADSLAYSTYPAITTVYAMVDYVPLAFNIYDETGSSGVLIDGSATNSIVTPASFVPVAMCGLAGQRNLALLRLKFPYVRRLGEGHLVNALRAIHDPPNA